MRLKQVYSKLIPKIVNYLDDEEALDSLVKKAAMAGEQAAKEFSHLESSIVWEN